MKPRSYHVNWPKTNVHMDTFRYARKNIETVIALGLGGISQLAGIACSGQ